MTKNDIADHYLEGMQNCDSTKEFVANTSTILKSVKIDGHSMPLTINSSITDNSYVCSPYSAYIRYAYEELDKIEEPALRGGLRCILPAISTMLRLGKIDTNIHINNWLFSTNLYPDWQGQNLSDEIDRIKQKHPDHAIIFRSLCEELHKDLMSSLEGYGFDFLPSRSIYLVTNPEDALSSHHNLKIDKKLLEKTQYTRVQNSEIHEADFERIIDLYGQLYLNKYSTLNPAFTEDFAKWCHKNGILEFEGFRDNNGQLVAINGYYTRNNVMTTTIVGYDMSVPRKNGLYRLLMVIATLKAAHHGYLLHFSSGAGRFKRLRGATPHLEYSAIYTRHLPLYRRTVFKILKQILHKVAAPIILKREL